MDSIRSQAREAGDDAAHSQLEQGAALIAARSRYKDACGACHGDSLGDTGSAGVDFSSPRSLIDLTPERILNTLAGEAHADAASGLSESDRAAVIGYIRNYLMLPAPEESTDIGRAIYSRSCSVCHGERGDAASWAQNSLDPPPADFTAHSLGQLSRESMIHAVTFGMDRSAMMPFAVQLTAEEIAATVDYIRAAFMTETGGDASGHGHHNHRGAHAHGEEDRFPGGLEGDLAWGRAFYNANCAECHGKDGGGEGPRAYFMVVKPKNFLTPGARAELKRPILFDEISNGVRGTTMPAWRTVLNEQQIANVAEYVFQAFLDQAPHEPQPARRGHADKAREDDHSGHNHDHDHDHSKKN